MPFTFPTMFLYPQCHDVNADSQEKLGNHLIGQDGTRDVFTLSVQTLAW